MSMSSFAAPRRLAASLLCVLVAVAGLIGLLSWHSSASADPYPPSSGCSISVSDTTVTAGETVSVTGSGFPANTTVTLTLHSTPAALGTVRTDANGSFRDSVTIPASASAGDHTIVASSGSVTCQFDPVKTSTGTSTTTSANGGTPASTGFAAITATGIALALLAGGLAFVLVGRRRDRQS